MHDRVWISAALVAITCGLAKAQAPDTLWTRTYGGTLDDCGYSLCFAPGGYLLAGFTTPYENGNRDVYLVKVTPFGDTIWTTTVGTNAEEVARRIYRLPDESFGIVGHRGDYPMWSNIYFARVDSSGSVVWERVYGPGYWTAARSFKQTRDLGFVVAGRCGGVDGFYQIKTTPNGDTVWTRIHPFSYNAGANDVIQTPDDGFLLAGTSGAGTWETSWNVDLLKTDSIGTMEWQQTYGDTAYGKDDWACWIQPTRDGCYVIAASTQTFGDGGVDFWLMKINRLGDTLWTRTYGGHQDDSARCVIAAQAGGYVIVGSTNSYGQGAHDVYVVRVNETGDTLWTKTIGGRGGDSGLQVIETAKNSFVIVGVTESYGAGGQDVYLIKLAPETVGINEEGQAIPATSAISHIYPNPFNETATIGFVLAKPGQFSLTLYNVLGQKIRTLAAGFGNPGKHSVSLDGGELPSGMYFCCLETDGCKAVRTICVRK